MELKTGKELYIEDIVVNYANNFNNIKFKLSNLIDQIENEIEYPDYLKSYIKDWIKERYNDNNISIRLYTKIKTGKINSNIETCNYKLVDIDNNIIWNDILPFVLKPLAKMSEVEYIYYDNDVITIDDLDIYTFIEDLNIEFYKKEDLDSIEVSEKEEPETITEKDENKDNEDESDGIDFRDSLEKLRKMGIV